MSKELETAEAFLAQKKYQECHQLCMSVINKYAQSAQAGYDQPEAKQSAAKALFLLAVLASEHGNHAKAVDVFEKALSLDQTRPEFYAHYAKNLLILSRRTEALSQADKAASLSPTDQHTLDTLGVVYSRSGLHKKAESFYSEALNAGKPTADILYNYATTIQFLGNLGRAKELYEQVIELNPDHVRAWSALTMLEKQTVEKNNIARLEASFAKTGGTADTQLADTRLNLGHAIAKSYEDIGELSKSIDWLEQAKKLKKGELNYEIEVDQPMFAAAMRSAEMPISSVAPNSKSPIFVVGLPRTGTTLIDRIISSHSKVDSVGELSDFAVALKRQLKTSAAYVVDEETILAALKTDLHAVGRAYRDSVSALFSSSGRSLDKMPLNFLSSALIVSAIPDAKVICVRRNPADTILSNYRQLFATQFSYYNYTLDLKTCAQYYVEFDRLIAAFADNLPKKSFLQVHYEDVVRNIDAQARRMIEFCELDWEDACVNFQDNDAPVATASSAQVRAPLYSSSIGRWRKVKDEIRAAIDVLEEAQIDY